MCKPKSKKSGRELWDDFKTTVLAWSSMVLAILAGSAIGPMFKYMENHHISPCLAASWRCQCMIVFLFPLALIENKCTKNQDPEESFSWLAKKPDLRYPVVVYVIGAGLSWAANLLFWINSLKFTTTVRASLLASTHPLLLVIFMKMTGKPISTLEFVGVAIAILGIALATLKNFIEPFTDASTPVKEMAVRQKFQFFGDILCILAAAAEVFVITNRQCIKKYVPLMQYTAWTTLMVAMIASVFAIILETDGSSRSLAVFCIQENCIFGWLNYHWLPKILLFGLIVGVVCIAGFNYAMQYISPLVFSSVTLVDPAVTGVISWAAGLEGIPDVWTWLGGVVVMAGVGVVSLGEHRRLEHEQAQQEEADDAETEGVDGDVELELVARFDLAGTDTSPTDKPVSTPVAATVSSAESCTLGDRTSSSGDSGKGIWTTISSRLLSSDIDASPVRILGFIPAEGPTTRYAPVPTGPTEDAQSEDIDCNHDDKITIASTAPIDRARSGGYPHNNNSIAAMSMGYAKSVLDVLTRKVQLQPSN